jgi:hypothetical protein
MVAAATKETQATNVELGDRIAGGAASIEILRGLVVVEAAALERDDMKRPVDELACHADAGHPGAHDANIAIDGGAVRDRPRINQHVERPPSISQHAETTQAPFLRSGDRNHGTYQRFGSGKKPAVNDARATAPKIVTGRFAHHRCQPTARDDAGRLADLGPVRPQLREYILGSDGARPLAQHGETHDSGAFRSREDAAQRRAGSGRIGRRGPHRSQRSASRCLHQPSARDPEPD